MTNYIIWLYVTYLLFITAATIYVGKTLFNHSKVFMTTIFNDRDHLAIATNRLFEMGFYLLALGIGFLFLKVGFDIETLRMFYEAASIKVGGYTLFLGVLLMLNLYLFFRGMKHRSKKTETNQTH